MCADDSRVRELNLNGMSLTGRLKLDALLALLTLQSVDLHRNRFRENLTTHHVVRVVGVRPPPPLAPSGRSSPLLRPQEHATGEGWGTLRGGLGKNRMNHFFT
jgi:hypothetical protein